MRWLAIAACATVGCGLDPWVEVYVSPSKIEVYEHSGECECRPRLDPGMCFSASDVKRDGDCRCSNWRALGGTIERDGVEIGQLVEGDHRGWAAGLFLNDVLVLGEDRIPLPSELPPPAVFTGLYTWTLDEPLVTYERNFFAIGAYECRVPAATTGEAEHINNSSGYHDVVFQTELAPRVYDSAWGDVIVRAVNDESID